MRDNFPGIRIDQKRVDADPALTYTAEASGDTLRVNIAGINPSEGLSIKLLASAPQFTRSDPKISVRGHGVNGVAETKEDSQNHSAIILPLAGSVLVAFGSEFVLTRLRRKASPEMQRGHSGDQRGIFAYILRLNGFEKEANELEAKPTETTYWVEADRLTHTSISQADPDRTLRAAKSLEDLIIYASVAVGSQALILLNIAKLYASLGRI